LAENAGLKPIEIVTELRKAHAEGTIGAGIDVKHGSIANMYDQNVIQPLLVTTSAIKLATETVCMILKVRDVSVYTYGCLSCSFCSLVLFDVNSYFILFPVHITG